jgi:hypothetical protein
MRRTWIISLAVVMTLMMALPAGAKKPDKPPGQPEPINGMSCLEWFGESTPVAWEDNTFTLSKTHSDWTCVDLADVPAGTWTVGVVVGDAREVTVQLRSSVPGDWCWVESTRVDAVFTFPNTPASEPNACPIGGAGGETIPDEDPALAFTVLYTGKKTLSDPVEITVTLPQA